MALAKLHTPNSPVERMTTVALLEGCGIRCFDHGGAFNRLMPGTDVGSGNALAIYVEEGQLQEARLLLAAPPLWDEEAGE